MKFGKAAKFSQLPITRQLALMEALVLLVVAWLLTRVSPYSWWARSLGPAGGVRESSAPVNETEKSQIVCWAVETAVRQLPWKIVCLPQAMAGKWMLARRKVDSTLCIGVRKPPAPVSSGAEMHAWLAVGNGAPAKGEVVDDYRIIARFGSVGGPRPDIV